MMSSFNVNFGNSHLLSETEGSRRPKGQAATLGMRLRMQRRKKAKTKSNLRCRVILQNVLTLDLMSMARLRMRELSSIKKCQTHR